MNEDLTAELEKHWENFGEFSILADNDVLSEQVNHPAHYNRGNIEVADFIADQDLNFFLGNVVKYICRAGYKNKEKTVEDLKKALWYLKKNIELVEGSDIN